MTPAPAKKPSDPQQTPAMRQYARFKAQHPDCVLLFRMGDFYELFFDDAVEIARVLGLTLTQRTQGVPMAGVPYHAVEGYLRRMIEHGYRVAVCDQVQDPKEAKGIVERAVTRVITPGTLVDEPLLDESRSNQIVAFEQTPAGAAAAVIELSTGRFTLLHLPHERIIDEIARLEISELLYAETEDGQKPQRIERLHNATGCALTARPAWSFRITDARDLLKAHYGVNTLAGFGVQDDDPAIGPAGALLRYLQETQSPHANGEDSTLRHLQPPLRHRVEDHLILDATTIHSLELERTMRRGDTQGSLLWVLQRCRSPMGRRLLRHWLCFPLRDLAAIESRQQAVAALLDDEAFAERLADVVGGIQDVARIVGRVSMSRAGPRDLVALGNSLQHIQPIIELLAQRPAFAPTHDRLATLATTLDPLAVTIRAQCADEPPAHLRDGGVFRDGVDDELDEIRTLQRDANSWLATYQKRLIKESGIGSLKVGYNKVFGYYIEVTHAHVDKIPTQFTRKQTLKNAERYITPDLKSFEDRITTADARAIDREKQLFELLCAQAAELCDAVSQFAETIAQLDVLWSFSEAARRHRYVRPQIVDDAVLDIRQGRHPVLDRTLGERFVPNDCALGQHDGASLGLITGPNMAGKSTYIRQNALIVLLAHTGSFVPAESATIGLTDRIFTRIGASDELHAGHSTFMVEMTETANILHHADERSLVILDEIGRGTSTLDGLSLAWAIAESLSRIGCRTLFATHYHELTSLADVHEEVTNLHVAIREWGDEIVFLYRIMPGSTDRSYGIHVAKIAGLPDETIDRAKALLKTLTVQTEASASAASPPTAPPAGGQLGLFTEYLEHPAIKELKRLDIDVMSPVEAFDLIRQLKARIVSEEESA
jgi:DNA mismatch repair protein MutS